MKHILSLAFLILGIIGAIEAKTISNENLHKMLSSEEKNPEGIILEVSKLIEKVDFSNDPIEGYQLKVKNLKVDQSYIFGSRNMLHQVTQRASCHAHKTDDLMLFYEDGRKTTLSEEKFFMDNICLGEKIEFFLISQDGKTCLKSEVIPHPIETKGKNGAYLTIAPTSAEAKSFRVEGNGFLFQEKLNYQSRSENEVMNHEISANEKGEIRLTLAPAVIGKKEGDASIAITRENGEILSLNYCWGAKVWKNPVSGYTQTTDLSKEN
jgi:hypothetical protein